MPIHIQCPQCQKTLNVLDALQGKTIRCPRCKATTKVPAGPAHRGADDEPHAPSGTQQGKGPRQTGQTVKPGNTSGGEFTELARPAKRRERDVDDSGRSRARVRDESHDDELPRRSPRRQASGSPLKWIVAGIVGLLVVGGGVAGTFWFAMSKPDQAAVAVVRESGTDNAAKKELEEASKKAKAEAEATRNEMEALKAGIAKKEAEAATKLEDYRKQAEDAKKREVEEAKKAERNAAELAASRLAAEKLKTDEAARLAAAEKMKTDEAARLAAEKMKTDEAARLAAAEKMKTDEAARLAAAEKMKTDEAARLAAEKMKTDEAARLAAAEKMKSDEAIRLASEKKRADDAKLTQPKPPDPKQGVVPNPSPAPNPVAIAGQPVPVPDGPTPAFIEPDTTKRVKRATAYLKVTDADGKQAEGSGFFGMERGIVLTNAHVVGMLQANSKAPKKVEIVAHSGTPDEMRFEGTVLGADRESDLAVVRVDGDLAKLPAPLPVELDRCSLTELQKVFIFGFPLGASLGKEITAAESSVSSFRRDVDGSLYQIQVNGGMHPGNSGGPVVDARGVVVGVAVAGIRGTQINFAVPSEKIQGMLHGRVQETTLGEVFLQDKTVKLPLKIVCLDPLNRVRDVKVDIWTGPTGPARTTSFKAPATLPGDSPRQSTALTYQQGLGTLDLVLPTLSLPAGHVYWFQPMLVTHAGLQQWGASTTLNPSGVAPLNRIPVNLSFSAATSERTLTLAGKFEFQMAKGKEKVIESDDLNFQVLEEMTNDPKGAALRVAMGKGEFTTSERGKTKPRQAEAQTLVKRKIFTYATDPTGRLEKFGFPQFRPLTPIYNPNVRINPKIRLPPPPPLSIEKEIMFMEAEDMASMFNTTYQLSSLSVPNRQVQPLEVWDAKIAILVGTGRKKTTLDLVMKYTFEGSRTVNGKAEALITIAGELEKRATARDDASSRRRKSRIVGQGSFDVAAGFFGKLKVAVVTDGEFDGTAYSQTFEANLTRVPGNVYKIGPLPPPGGATVVAELEGVWDLVSGLWDGKDEAAKVGSKLTVTGRDYVYVHDNGKITESGKLIPNTTKTPKEVHMQFSGNQNRLCIFEVRDSTLTLCYAIGGALPKTFDPKDNVLMVWKRVSTGPVKADVNTRPDPKEGPAPKGWTVLFKSDDPALWNTNSPGGTQFAVPVRTAHSSIRFLKLTRLDTKESQIIPITHQQLARQPKPIPSEGYGWNGTASAVFGGRHLGIYLAPGIAAVPKGEIAVMLSQEGVNVNFRGSGFGHQAWVDDTQHYCWKGKEIPKTMFEIAVTTEPLTDAEKGHLLTAGLNSDSNPNPIVITGDMFEAVKKSVSDNRLSDLADGGRKNNNVFREVSSDGGILIGFEVGAARAIEALRPIYLTKDGEKMGNWYGGAPANPVSVKARPGYVVGKVTVRCGIGIDGMSIKFVKLAKDRVDPTDSYTSDWIGGPGGNTTVNLGQDGLFYVGVHGHRSSPTRGVCSLGLVTLERPKK